MITGYVVQKVEFDDEDGKNLTADVYYFTKSLNIDNDSKDIIKELSHTHSALNGVPEKKLYSSLYELRDIIESKIQDNSAALPILLGGFIVPYPVLNPFLSIFPVSTFKQFIFKL